MKGYTGGYFFVMKRIHIIQPSYYRSKERKSIARLSSRKLVSLALPYLASLTPDDWEVTVTDELLEDVDFDAPTDLVAITTWTLTSLRAYDIAQEFRKRGKLVIMGGPHVFFHTTEAMSYADAIAIGEGEYVWGRMLEDAAAGRLQPIYHADKLHDLKNLPFPRYDVLKMNRYGRIKTFAVQTSRGCPFKCDFCSERLYLGEGFRYRPVEDVVEEIKRCKGRYFLFADSNFGGDRVHAMELMEALIPLKIRWSALWSLYLCKDEAFMDLACRSGLLHLNLGMESINPESLRLMNKKQNKVDEYRQILTGLRKRGISYSLNLIFGLDGENMQMFDATVDFLKKYKAPVAYFNILTPHKGTPFYDRMMKENRILNPEDIGRWPGERCYIKPTCCSPEELEEHVKKLYRSFYNLPSMFSRLPAPITEASLASWFMNMSQWLNSRKPDFEDFGDF